jgi:hypothetical protein
VVGGGSSGDTVGGTAGLVVATFGAVEDVEEVDGCVVDVGDVDDVGEGAGTVVVGWSGRP